MNTIQQAEANDDHIPWLDGLRGIAALWVLLSHVQILTGMRDIPVLSWGGVAVDLFMMLSGFLMTHHYLLRRSQEPWHQRHTIALFWTRRFFRIAPLYYLLLLAALIVGPALGDFRSQIAGAWPSTGTEILRYTDQSMSNIATHLSFVFGMLPDYAFRTPLPDWSIGLEMQFYFAFPFIMIFFARVGPVAASVILIVVSALAKVLFPAFFAQFPMPAFLPLKLYVFLGGMLIAFGRREGDMKTMLAVALIFPLLQLAHGKSPQTLTQIALMIALFYLMDNTNLPGSRSLLSAKLFLRRWFSGRVAVFLGSTSYAVYLLHLLILLPIAGSFVEFDSYRSLPAIGRFTCVLALLLPLVYSLSWGLYRVVEIPGIQIGKLLIRRWWPQSQAIAIATNN